MTNMNRSEKMRKVTKSVSQKEIDKIIELHLEGVSSRNICLELGWSKSRKSTVNYVLADWRKGRVKVEEENLVSEEEIKLDNLCNNEDWSISNLAKRLRSAQRANNQLRKVQREVFDKSGTENLTNESFAQVLKNTLSVKDIGGTAYTETRNLTTSNKTVEILFSDWQWGKVSESWNTEIAERASVYYGKELLKIVLDTQPERIIFSSLGDLIEDALKHGVQSTASTDTSNAEQMANCIRCVWFNILQPLMKLGIPFEYVGVSGNHGASEHKGMDMFKAGRYGMDYVMSKSWEAMAEIANYRHVEFNLPEGHFATYRIYDKLTVAEHGYNCKGSSENAMIALRNKRSTNLQEFVHRLVIGDMHHLCNYDNGNLQVNGAAFGVAFDAIEYSGIMGFHAVPVQIVNIHEPTTGVGQNTVLETKAIQISKGYYGSF